MILRKLRDIAEIARDLFGASIVIGVIFHLATSYAQNMQLNQSR